MKRIKFIYIIYISAHKSFFHFRIINALVYIQNLTD